MKKLFTLLFAVGLVTAASAQTSDRNRNDSRSYDNSYQQSPNSSNDRGYSNQYSDRDNRNSQWNDRDRRHAEQQRYEMMKRRNQYQYRDERRYDNRSSGLVLPLLGLLSVIIANR